MLEDFVTPTLIIDPQWKHGKGCNTSLARICIGYVYIYFFANIWKGMLLSHLKSCYNIKNKLSDSSTSIIILNILIRRQILAKWIKIHNQTICCLQKTHFKFNDIGKLNVGQEKIYHANISKNNNKSKNGSTNIDKINFKCK